MRDIRRDLNERLEAIAKQRADLQAQLAEVDQAETSVKALLQHEEQQWAGKTAHKLILTQAEADHTEGNGFGRTPLSHMILETLKDSNRALALDDFKKHAKATGFDFGEKSPGRTLHYALIGLTENGHLECTGRKKDRKYRLREVHQAKTRAEAVQ